MKFQIAGFGVSVSDVDLQKGTFVLHALGKVGELTVNIHIKRETSTDPQKVMDFTVNVEAWDRRDA